MLELGKDPMKDKQNFELYEAVHVLPLDQLGRIVAIENNGTYRVQVNGKAWELESSKLRKWERQTEMDTPVSIATNVTYHGSAGTSLIGEEQSVDLHGLRVKDALILVERVIDQALLQRFRYLDLVHGIGTGQLKNALDRFLTKKKAENLIESFKLNDFNPGETRVFF